ARAVRGRGVPRPRRADGAAADSARRGVRRAARGSGPLRGLAARPPRDRPAVRARPRRDLLPALHLGHHRAAEGGRAHPPQLPLGDGRRVEDVVVRRREREPRGDAAVPHRGQRLGPGRAVQRRHEHHHARGEPRRDPEADRRARRHQRAVRARCAPDPARGAGRGADRLLERSIVYGASPISEEVLVRSMKTFGCGFVQAYGLTETTGGMVALVERDHDPGGARAELLRSAGQPWGDAELRIVDPESGRDLPDGEVGEIWIRSPQNMKGYWRNPEATAQCFPEGRSADGRGWFRSGDAGYLRDGYLFIYDRVKDMIVSGGENIYPAEIENALMSHPAVADVAVVGVPSE